MHKPHPTSLDPSPAIGYTIHQKSQAYFSHLAPLVLFFFTKRLSEKEGGMPPPNTLLFNTDM